VVTIRLSRGGTIKRPFFHIVATDHRNRRDGRYLERLGFFNPIAAGQEKALKVDLERVDYWMKRGAQVSSRVAHLLARHRAAQSTAEGTAAV
jgi:small subunit ribosomal protein S16